MIVCSQTCFLNVLTQLYPKETLLNAAYYIADLTGPGGIPQMNQNDAAMNGMMYTEETQYKYNEDGELVKVGSPVKAINVMQKYHICYTQGAMNPTCMLTSLRMGKETPGTTPEMRYVKSLQDTDSAIEIYHDLFYNKPRGNGLQILIYLNDKICCQFGWITCEYLSSCWGADIIFIDAKYRKKIAKQAKFTYEGNKKFAFEQYIPWVRDQELLESFKSNLTHCNMRECISNVSVKLNIMNWGQLIHLYNLLWPMDPLPQGNYSVDQLREIIMHKCLSIRKPNMQDKLDNLYAADAFYQMANEYDL